MQLLTNSFSSLFRFNHQKNQYYTYRTHHCTFTFRLPVKFLFSCEVLCQSGYICIEMTHFWSISTSPLIEHTFTISGSLLYILTSVDSHQVCVIHKDMKKLSKLVFRFCHPVQQLHLRISKVPTRNYILIESKYMNQILFFSLWELNSD